MTLLFLKICLGEQFLIKYCVTKQLILLKIQNMMDIKEILLECIKKTSGGAVESEVISNHEKISQKNNTNEFSEDLNTNSIL